MNLFDGSPNAVIRRDGRIVILDDGDRPTITLYDAVVEEGRSTHDLLLFPTPAPQKLLRYGARTVDGTAKAGTDYSPTIFPTYYSFAGRPIQLGPAEPYELLRIDTLIDDRGERDEQFTVEIYEFDDPTTVVARATVTIKERGSLPWLTVTNSTVAEGSTASFDIVMSNPSTEKVSFRVTAIADGAEPGLDFEALSNVYTFAPGETRTTIRIPTVNDGEIEGDERFSLQLSQPWNVRIEDSIGRGTILDDDNPAVPVLSVASVNGRESARSVRFTVELAAPAPSRMAYSYYTEDGTATSGADYIAGHGPLVFERGERVKTIDVTLVDDTAAEKAETFTLRLSNGLTATATIEDDDVGRRRAVRR